MGPFVITSRRWVHRFGPGSSPVSGAGVFLAPYSWMWMITTVPLEQLLSAGIVLQDFDTFLRTDTGAAFFAEHTCSYRLAAGNILYVPHGKAIAQIVIKDDKSSSNCATMLAFPVVATELAAAMSGQAWAAVVQANRAYHKTKSEKCWVAAGIDLASLEKDVAEQKG